MGYWKDKVIPTFKRVFERNGLVKKACDETCKTFDESKVEIDKELEEKREELQPKVLDIYEACTPDMKAVLKDRTEPGVQKESTGVNKFLEDLARIDFPGSKLVSEASSKYGAAMVSGPVFFLFERVSYFLPVEELTGAAKDAAVDKPEPAEAAEAEEASAEERDVGGEKKDKEVREKEAEVVAPPPLNEPATASPVAPPGVPQ